MIVEVALNLPLRNTFDYLWPETWELTPEAGMQVLVPFGPQKKGGIIVGVKAHSEFERLKRITSLIDETHLFSKEMLALSQWVSEYYFCAWGEVLNAAVPGGLSLKLKKTYTKIANDLPDSAKLSPQISVLIQNQLSWTHQEWMNNKPNENDFKLLKHWIQEEKLSSIQELLGQKTKPKMERWVRLLQCDKIIQTSRKKSKKVQIYEILAQNNEISWSDLQTQVISPSQVLRKMKEDGRVEFFEKRVYRRFLEGGMPAKEAFQDLTQEQHSAYQEVSASLKKNQYQSFLLEGVTGSGKTEVYLHAVREARSMHKSCLVLVPEISLTPQLVNRFRSRFGDQVAVLHSGMDDGERFDEWSRVRYGIASIVVGARSAVFAPLENLGLIVVDEEHDPSYKQGETPRYHGRDVAIYRGYSAGATVLLGSATPSLESAQNVKSAKYQELRLPSRIHQAQLPSVKLLNMKTVARQKGSPYFSRELVDALRQRLLQKEQSIVFLNRRGFAPLVRCADCGETQTCPNCSLSLVYHQAANQVCCHQCDYTKVLANRCAICEKEGTPQIIGTGTEQVEENLKMFFPDARILRMDRDSLHGKHALSKMHDRIKKHEVDIVIGTQLVTKGHDFPEVTLVGVIMSDLSLNIPDFRAGERTFQLLTQVAGRAGRGEKAGEVLIQTHNPHHHSLMCAQKHDTVQFRNIELEQRESLRMPPFHSLILIVCSSPSEQRAQFLAQQLQQIIIQLQPYFTGVNTVSVSGPLEAPMKKLRNRFRQQILLKANNSKILLHLVKSVFKTNFPTRRDELIQVDVDPHHLM